MWRAIRTLFRCFVGDLEFNLDGAEHQVAGEILLGSYLVVMLVLMLNLLIAVLSVKHAELVTRCSMERCGFKLVLQSQRKRLDELETAHIQAVEN
eukprot:COSAG01_NODE_56166_length_320_cov_0.751131_1_plen_94_part_01